MKKEMWLVENIKRESRRGDYNLVTNTNLIEWEPKPLGTTIRELMVKEEILHAKIHKLGSHPYWADEPEEFIEEYAKLYRELFKLEWLHEASDRHNLVVNKYCCVTLVQYHNGKLICYSRSTDMRNGYYSDKLMLDYLAEVINEFRPDCKVEKIIWFLACPHLYVKKGIARLGKEDE